MSGQRAMRLRNRVYEILEPADEGDRASRAFDVFILGLITLNVVALVVETVETAYRLSPAFFWWFELISVIVFSIEYVLRIWSCTSDPVYASPVRGRLRFAVTPLAQIDLFAVLPFYLPFLGVDFRFARAVRLFRLFRVAKLGRYSSALQTLGRVFASRKEQLAITVSVLLMLLLSASSLIYFFEHDAQPQVFSSIPAAMWWGVAAVSPVSSADVYPVTATGKALSAVIAILGIGMFALPTGILGAAFVEELDEGKRGPQVCPHCGGPLEKQ